MTGSYPDILAQWKHELFSTLDKCENYVYNDNFAYKVAVEKGFTGTKEEWLETMRGPKGDTYVRIGATEPTTDTYLWFDTSVNQSSNTQ